MNNNDETNPVRRIPNPNPDREIRSNPGLPPRRTPPPPPPPPPSDNE